MTRLTSALAASLVAASLALSTVAPAKADGAAVTRNILLGAAAVAGIAIESNVARKNAKANAVAGYTADGGTVYQDGRVTYQNGRSYYPGNNGQQVSCSGQSCVVTGNGNEGDNGNVAYNGNGGYNNGGYNNNGGYGGNTGYSRSRHAGWRDR